MGVADSHIRFTLRIPEEMREKLQKIAKQNHRSLNSELIVILQRECDLYDEKNGLQGKE